MNLRLHVAGQPPTLEQSLRLVGMMLGAFSQEVRGGSHRLPHFSAPAMPEHPGFPVVSCGGTTDVTRSSAQVAALECQRSERHQSHRGRAEDGEVHDVETAAERVVT